MLRFLIGLILWPFEAWMFMLAIGVAHYGWWPAVPTIGYGTSFLLVALLSGAFIRIPEEK